MHTAHGPANHGPAHHGPAHHGPATPEASALPDVSAHALGKRFDIYKHDRDRVLELFSRTQRHEPFWALKEVSFEVPRGCAFGIIGSNGAGKSTLLRMLAGVSPPTEGELVVRASRSSLLDLGLGFHMGFSGRQNIYLTCTLMGLEPRQIDALVPDILAFSELEGFIDYPVRTWSAGMCLRLGFSIAAHLDQQLFLIDEVLTVGDQYFQRKCVKRIERFIEHGRTIVLVSHDLHAIRSLCNRVLWLRQGRTVLEGPAAAVVDAYLDAVRAREGTQHITRLDGSTDRSPSMPLQPPPAEAVPAQTFPAEENGAPEAQADSSPSTPTLTLEPTPDQDTGKDRGKDTVKDMVKDTVQDSALPVQPAPSESPEPRSHAHVLDAQRQAQPVTSEALPSPAGRPLAYRATTPDPRLRARLLERLASPHPEAVLTAMLTADEAPTPMQEYHGDLPVVTGSGEARILAVRFLNSDGQDRDRFVTRDELVVAVTFKALEPILDPIFGVAIHRNDDVYVYGPNSHFDRCLKGTYHGVYTFFLHYPSLPLLTGTYLVSVALWDRHHLKPYVWHNRLYPLVFHADREDHGLVVIPHHWGMVTHASGADEQLVDPPQPLDPTPMGRR